MLQSKCKIKSFYIMSSHFIEYRTILGKLQLVLIYYILTSYFIKCLDILYNAKVILGKVIIIIFYTMFKHLLN